MTRRVDSTLLTVAAFVALVGYVTGTRGGVTQTAKVTLGMS